MRSNFNNKPNMNDVSKDRINHIMNKIVKHIIHIYLSVIFLIQNFFQPLIKIQYILVRNIRKIEFRLNQFLIKDSLM